MVKDIPHVARSQTQAGGSISRDSKPVHSSERRTCYHSATKPHNPFFKIYEKLWRWHPVWTRFCCISHLSLGRFSSTLRATNRTWDMILKRQRERESDFALRLVLSWESESIIYTDWVKTMKEIFILALGLEKCMWTSNQLHSHLL